MQDRMRISSIDLFRGITVFYIIIAHGIRLYRATYPEPWTVTDSFIVLGVRFAIPFFSMVAGYFFGERIRAGADPQALLSKYTKRLFFLFISWSIIYFLIPPSRKSIYLNYLIFVSDPVTFMLAGTRPHLWFLMAMILSLGIVEIFVSRRQESKLIWVSIILYLLGLLGGPYSFIPDGFGIDIPFKPRGLFFTTLFFTAGWFLSSGKFFIKPSLALLLTVFGYLFHMVECFVLMRYFDVAPWTVNYSIGTVFFGTGLMLFLFSKREIGRDSPFLFMGKYTLGVYLIHLLFLSLVTPLRVKFHSLFAEVATPFVVYILSFTTTYLCMQNRILKRFFI